MLIITNKGWFGYITETDIHIQLTPNNIYDYYHEFERHLESNIVSNIIRKSIIGVPEDVLY